MKNLFSVLISFVCLACIEPEYLYLDKNCSMDEIQAVFRAVNKLNNVLGYEEVAVVGSKQINYEYEANNDNDVSVLMCINSLEDGSHFPKFDISVGRKWRDDIYVRSDITTHGEYGVRGFEYSVMHELMHFVGVKGSDHSDDCKDVISKYFCVDEMPIEYSSDDKALIKKYARL